MYTGVGSRKTPKDIQNLMVSIAANLAAKGYTLRSGGADGADKAFEYGCGVGAKEIYLPNMATPEAMEIAAKYHGAWDKCSAYVRKLHGRNAFQVLGLDLKTPSKFLLCWTPDGCISHKIRSVRTGGTGTAISIADAYGIPVFNLKLTEHRVRLEAMLNKKEISHDNNN